MPSYDSLLVFVITPHELGRIFNKMTENITWLLHFMILFSNQCHATLHWSGRYHGARSIEFNFSCISCHIYNSWGGTAWNFQVMVIFWERKDHTRLVINNICMNVIVTAWSIPDKYPDLYPLPLKWLCTYGALQIECFTLHLPLRIWLVSISSMKMWNSVDNFSHS